MMTDPSLLMIDDDESIQKIIASLKLLQARNLKTFLQIVTLPTFRNAQ